MLSKPPASHPEIPPTRRGLGLTLLTRAKNPSQLVRALYLQPALAPHTFLSGATSENIGQSLGETVVDPSYFFTEHRWREHRHGLGLPEEPLPHSDTDSESPYPMDQLPTGTVGAVALDIHGCVVALTSTGGRTNKLVGRIGDTPVMGSGFWAEEWTEMRWLRQVWNLVTMKKSVKQAVGISGTGDGDVSTYYLSTLQFTKFINMALHILLRSTLSDSRQHRRLLTGLNTAMTLFTRHRQVLLTTFSEMAALVE